VKFFALFPVPGTEKYTKMVPDTGFEKFLHFFPVPGTEKSPKFFR